MIYCIMKQSNFQPTSTYSNNLFQQAGVNPQTPEQPVTNSYQFPTHNFPANSYPYRTRPASFSNGRPPQHQAFILAQQPNNINQNKTLKVDYHPQRLPFQSQNTQLIQNQALQNEKLNECKEKRTEVQNYQSVSNQKNQRMKKPISYSTFFSIQQKDRTVRQSLLLHFAPNQSLKKKEDVNELKLPLNNIQDYSKKQSKTDRDAPSSSMISNFSIPCNLNYVNQSNQAKAYKKPQIYQLDSTFNSSLSRNASGNKVQIQVKKDSIDSRIIKKNISPPNFWPLSISPSQQKRQNVLYEQLIVPQQPQQPNNQSIGKQQHNNEFKKKKNFQFLRSLKRKLTSIQPPAPLKEFQLSDFQLMDKIGKGVFGDVYIAKEKITGFLCVLKRLSKRKLIENKIQQHLLREIKIQSYLGHRHLTSLYGFFSDQTYIYLILELMPDGSMMQVKKKRKIPEPQVSSYVRQICLGLKYMHTQNVIHRDIKPENIFLNQGYAKIGDFGCSIYTQTLRNTQIGSLAYLSPEQLKQETYNDKIDVWSLGVMTYEMVVGISPFEADIIMIAKKERAPELSKLKFPPQIQLSEEVKDFLNGMLDLDPNKRLGIQQALRHEFIQRYLREDSPKSDKIVSC